MRRLVTHALIVVAALSLPSACSHRLDLSQAESQMKFGVKAAKMNLWREAQFRFAKAVELNPGNPEALNNLAVAYESTGEFDKAKQTYLRALQVDRSNRYIQKNYSRFTEFYSRNERRQQSVGQENAVPSPSPPAAGPAPAPGPAAAPATTPAPSPTPKGANS